MDKRGRAGAGGPFSCEENGPKNYEFFGGAAAASGTDTNSSKEFGPDVSQTSGGVRG